MSDQTSDQQMPPPVYAAPQEEIQQPAPQMQPPVYPAPEEGIPQGSPQMQPPMYAAPPTGMHPAEAQMQPPIYQDPLQGDGNAAPQMQPPQYMDPNLQVAQPGGQLMQDPHSYGQAAPGQEWGEAAAYKPEEDMSNIRPVPRVAIQAFCETESVSVVIDRASQDRRMNKAHVKVQLGGIAAAVEFYQTATTPNLILVESRLVGSDLLGELEKLADVCDEGTNVVVIGHKNDVQLYRDLISRGVAEYLYAPINMSEVMDVISTLFVNPESEPLGNIIAFVGSKGGVGSSTVAHNVAWAISSSFESDVVLADFDLAFGTANIDFDQDPAQGVAEAVFSADRIDETFLDRLLAKCSDHLSLLAAPSTLDREYDFDTNDFDQLLEVAQRGTPNVIVDLPHVWTGWARQTLSMADKVVITATPDLASLRNTKNLVDTLTELRPNDDKPFLVLNQCNIPKRPEISIEDFTQPLGIEPAIVVPFDPPLFGLAANNGQMIVETNPKSEIAASFEQLAQIITGRREIEAPVKKSMGSFLSKFSLKKKSA